MPDFVKVDHKKMMHTGGNDAKLKTKLSKSSPFKVKMLGDLQPQKSQL